jgi:TRAP-type C4-dicarboxylate transport system permease small subunit
MLKFFTVVDKAKPVFDMVDKAVMLVCKLLLLADIVITCMAVAGRFISFIPDPAWTEEVVLTLMCFMAVLSASIAIRNNTHIRLTAFDKYLPKKLIEISDILSDTAVLALAVVMITIGLPYALRMFTIHGTYASMPWLSRFWMYLPIPVAGVAMIIFTLESIYNHIKNLFLLGHAPSPF